MAATVMDTKKASASCPLLGLLSTDLLLEVVAFLNAPSLARFAQCDRLLYVLAADWRMRQPAFLAVHGPLTSLADTALERYPAAAAPNVGLLFATASASSASIAKALERRMPPGLKLVGARCRFPLYGKDDDIVQGTRLDSSSAVMSLLTLPDVHVRTFMPRQQELVVASGAPTTPESRRVLRQQILGLDDDLDYKMVVLLSTGSDAQSLELVMGLLDERWPNAAVVGGIATSVFLWEGSRLITSRDTGMGGVVGLALAGDVPLHAIVSRGVSPRSPRLVVVEHEFDEREGMLVVRSLRVPPPPGGDGGSIFGGEGQLLSPLNALYHFDVAGSGDLYVGLQEEEEQHDEGSGPAPFALLNFDFAQESDQTILLLQCKSKPRPGSRLAVRFFELESERCRADVEEKMRAVAREVKELNQVVLGSLLFSCNGRGPARFLDLQGAAAGIDARAFTAAFPNTCCTGFYAMGEIGPQSIWTEQAVQAHEQLQQQPQQQQQGQVSPSLALSQTGSSALQGFTAVFAVLCVPKRGPNHGSRLLGVLQRQGTAAALASVLGGNGKGAPQASALGGAGSAMDT